MKCFHATWDDVPHLSEQAKAKLWAETPAHMREARSKGIPVLGSGRVFMVAEEEIRVDPFPIPKHWAQIIGLDFGWDHPAAASRAAWDRDNDVFYITAGYRQSNATPVIQAAAIKPWGSWIPVAWPHDGFQHDKGSGLQLAEQYRAQGLEMLPEHATHEAGGFGLEAGIMEMAERMQTGRWRVFSTVPDWFDEYRLYHRKDGLIVKKRDDLISSSRIALMMRRHAIVEPKSRSWGQPKSGWVV